MPWCAPVRYLSINIRSYGFKPPLDSQDMDLFFTYAHRRSCSILQRSSTEDTSLTDSMSQLLDGEIEDASHDFDKIKQEGCEYDKEKVLNIDVDKILGLKGNSEVRDAVNEAASELEFDKKTIEEIREEAVDLLRKK